MGSIPSHFNATNLIAVAAGGAHFLAFAGKRDGGRLG